MKNNKKRVEFKLKINLWKAILIFLGILFFAPLFLAIVQNSIDNSKIELSEALRDIQEEKVEKIVVQDEKLIFTYKDGNVKHSTKEPSISFSELLDRAKIDSSKVQYSVSDQAVSKMAGEILGILLPLGLMAAFFFILLRAQNKGAQDIFSFGRSKAKLFAKGKQSVTFADVAGVDEAKKELVEIVDFLQHPVKYRNIGARTPKGVLLFGPSGVGKCVTGDTMVWTNKGLMEIRDIPRYYYVNPRTNRAYGAGLASFDLDSISSANKLASHWYDLGEQETVHIQSARGFDLEGTPEHPVVVMTSDGVLKFRKLENIVEGDSIAIQFGRRMFGNLRIMEEDTAYLMGILTGDGNMSHASRIALTSVDEEIIQFFQNYVTKYYPSSAITIREQSYLVANWDFKRFLYQMGMSYLLSFDKVIPPTVLQSPKEIQVAFLRGLFDTDGCIETKRATVEYTTVSRRMARQVHMMLLNMGVVASLNVKGKKSKGYYRDVYRITVTGSALPVFAKEIGFALTRKKNLLQKHVSKMVRSNTNVDIIPGIGHLVEESWKEISKRKLSKEHLSRVIDKVRHRGGITRDTLSEYVSYCISLEIEVPHLEYFRSLLESKLFFSPVINITKNFNRVFDFTVPQTHSFLGNGLLNHNTLLAKAVAGEAGVPFFSMAGSEFMEMLVGVGASRVRDLFATAKASAPSIIFIDEVDAIGRQRGRSGFVGGHDEREQTLNQILVEMDGFTPNDNVIVIAATNRGDLLDPALLRPGRFDRRITLDMPDKEGRQSILSIHARNKKFSKLINWERIADRTVGFSGADLENMLNEAAISAARDNKKEIDMEDIEEAATKVKLGPAKRRLQSSEDRTITAYHEAGHAIVTHILPKMDPVHRISIVARGMSLGHTLIPPAADRAHETKSRFLEQITAMLGGRAAEEVIYNEMTAGASNDIEKATRVARAMVSDFGMSKLGPINLGPQSGYDDFGNVNWTEPAQISQTMQEKVDEEVSKIIETCYKQAVSIVKKHKTTLDKIVKKLLEKETLDRDEFEKIVGFKAIEKKSS